MKLYRYWAGASADGDESDGPYYCYAGSDVSRDDAMRAAVEKSKRVAAIFESPDLEEFPGKYAYGERPLREEVVQRFENDGRLAAAVTRNSYGSLVLNAVAVLFADIDYPASSPVSLGGLIGKLFGKKSPSPKNSPDEEIIARVEQVARDRGDFGVRLYRTAAGFRVLATSRTFDPTSEATISLLNAFGSDPLYVRMCRGQECFRARLTPKHWRCGADSPPSRFPWRSEDEELEYRRWETDYHKSAHDFTTCELVGEFGPRQVHPAVADVLEIHDHLSLADGKPLA
jgi:hypothetical protein